MEGTMRKWMFAWPALVATLLLSLAVWAQGASKVVSKPPGTATIASTGTFQVAIAYNSGRLGGFIQNNGTNTMFVYFAGKATDCSAAAENTSAQLAPPGLSTAGDNVNFAYAMNRKVDEICITGTSGDSYSFSEDINAPP